MKLILHLSARLHPQTNQSLLGQIQNSMARLAFNFFHCLRKIGSLKQLRQTQHRHLSIDTLDLDLDAVAGLKSRTFGTLWLLRSAAQEKQAHHFLPVYFQSGALHRNLGLKPFCDSN